MSANHFGRTLGKRLDALKAEHGPLLPRPHNVGGCECPDNSKPCTSTGRREAGTCTRERYHDGPCNGFPRPVDSSKGVYCYTPRPLLVVTVRTLGEQVDDAISGLRRVSDRHEQDAKRLAADNRKLKEQIKRLHAALRTFEANCACGTDYDHVS